MHTVIAYQEVKPVDTTPLAITGVPDQHMRVDDTVIYMADINQIIGVFCCGHTTLTDAYLASPSLRRLANYAIAPIHSGSPPLGDASFILHPDSPLPLETNEGLEAILTASATVTTVASTVVVFLSDGPVALVSGEIFHVRATATIAATVDVWANAEMTFDDTLPVGAYQIVGARAYVTDGVAFRFVPIGEAYRPGGICSNTLALKTHNLQRNGGLGVWCEFNQITPPSIEVLVDEGASSNDVVIHLDLIKVG